MDNPSAAGIDYQWLAQMCVIIDKNPGTTLPQDKLELACNINNDGFGIAFVEKGRLRIRHNTDKNDPKVLQKELNKLTNKRVFLHLRHATVGAVNAANAHPIRLLAKETDGIDVGMMHNGTLYSWKPEGTDTVTSDTLKFANEFAGPLAARFVVRDSKFLLHDHFYRQLITKEAGTTNVLVFFDNLGNCMIINRDNGRQFDGWWASNTYSFQENHYRNKSWTPETTQDNHVSNRVTWPRTVINRRESLGMEPVEKKDFSVPFAAWEEEFVQQNGGTSSHNSSDGQKNISADTDLSPEELLKLKNAFEKIHTAVVKALGDQQLRAANGDTNQGELTMAELCKEISVGRDTFVELAKLQSINDVMSLSEDNFIDLCSNYPEAMAQLFLDLNGTFVSLRQRIETQANTIAELTKKVGGNG